MYEIISWAIKHVSHKRNVYTLHSNEDPISENTTKRVKKEATVTNVFCAYDWQIIISLIICKHVYVLIRNKDHSLKKGKSYEHIDIWRDNVY